MQIDRGAVAGACLAVFTLGGCTTNNTIVVAPGAGAAAGRAGILPVDCWLPEDMEHAYLVATITQPGAIVAPAFAKEKHINGCAALVFQLHRDGSVKDVTILRELPVGYGFADSAKAAVLGSTFAAPKSEQDWYYLAVSLTFGPGAPAPRLGVPHPPAPTAPAAPALRVVYPPR